MLLRPPKFIKKIYPSFIWSFPKEKDGLFLTFDDGPCPQVTPWVLDQLDKYGAKATFFCIGKNVEQYPDLFGEIVRRGHAVGSHTYSHIPGWRMHLDDYVQDVDMAAELIKTNLYRPLSRDYNRKLGHRACARNVLPYLSPGSITVFHDSMKASKNLWYALPKTLDAVSKAGWKCKPILL